MTPERSAARYQRLQLVLAALALVIGAGWLSALTGSGLSRLVAEHAALATDRWWWCVAVVGAVTSLGHTALTAPLSVARGYVLPRRFGLLHQRFGAWIVDRLKAAAIGALVGLVVIEVVYGVIAATPAWWIVAGAFVALVSLFGATVFPVWIVPLFYRLTPLGDAELSARLQALAHRAGVRAIGVWVVDHSRKSRTMNAAVAGFGRTQRIILFDTLIDTLGAEEVESVLAHELGHHAHRDTWRMLAAQTALGFATFWLADRILRATVGAVGLSSLADPAGVPWLALVLAGVGLITVPLVNAYSRGIERRADDFALSMTGNPAAFVRAMEGLADLNLAERRPPRWKEILFFSHPSIDRRIARAREHGGASPPRIGESSRAGCRVAGYNCPPCGDTTKHYSA